MFYFERTGSRQYRATEHVGGAWNEAEQHIAPALGLIAHAIEAGHAARRGDDGGAPLRLARVSYDILGVMPIAEVELDVAVLRPGRTIELVEARLTHGGRVAVIARAWLLQQFDTSAIAGSAIAAIPGPEDMPTWSPKTIWTGGFIHSVEVRRREEALGRAMSWVRSDAALIAGETVSPTARMLGLIDIANGLATRAGAGEVAFPNVDLTAHLFGVPQIGGPGGDWVGIDTRTSFGGGGVGLTLSTLHDARGPIGAVAQGLTVRPR